MTFQTIIFDMDGVLIDSEPAHLVAANAVLNEEGAHLSDQDNAIYLGWNEARYWQALVERFQLARDASYYIKKRHAVLVSMLKKQLPIAEGMIDFLKELKALGCTLAVASSSERGIIDHVVDKGGMSAYFDVIASGDEVSASKPDPEIFLLAASRLGKKPEECLVFEDSTNGVRAAVAANMTCVRVETETTKRLEFPSVAAVISGFVGVDAKALLELERN